MSFGLSVVASPPATAQAIPVVSTLTPDSGSVAGGASVTIVGTGLGGASAVMFGDVVSPLFRVESDERIVAFSPEHPSGPAVVRVRVGDDASTPDGPSFNYGVGSWTRAADPSRRVFASFEITATLLQPRACESPSPPKGYPCGAVLVAGDEGSGRLPSEIFDPAARAGAGTWAPTETLDRMKQHVATLLQDGRVLVTGGRFEEQVSSESRIFDPTATGTLGEFSVAGAWAPAPAMASARVSHTATLLDRPECHGASPPQDYPCGSVLVVGGEDADGTPQDVEVFDPDGGGSWASAPALALPRTRHTATLLGDGTVLVAGGSGPDGSVASAELFDPSAAGGVGKWTPLPAMTVARTGQSAVLLDRPDCHGTSPPPGYPCAKVLVAGGNSVAPAEELAEIYDPVSATWSPTGGSALLGPSGHSLAVLRDGSVLALSHSGQAIIPPAALYDATSGTWARASGLPSEVNRVAGNVTALADGRALATNLKATNQSVAYLFGSSSASEPVVAGIEPGAGPPGGGTAVTVRGSHLFGAPVPGTTGTTTQVRFGDALATALEFVSDSELIATSPPHAHGQVTVTVTTPGGTSRPVGSALFNYVDEGLWTSTGALDACDRPAPEDPVPACRARSEHRSVLLDPPACQSVVPPEGYPCGSVLAVGRTRATFTDGDVTRDSAILRSASARFVDDDVGMAVIVSSPAASVPPGTTIIKRIDADAVELSSPVGGSLGAGVRVTGVPFVVSGNTAERYSPATGLWTPTGPMVNRTSPYGLDDENNVAPQASLLGDGTVLVAGGCCAGSNDALAVAELYDPVTNTWSATTPMPGARVGHSATLLDRADCHGAVPPADGYPCGHVLIAGGAPRLNGPYTAVTTTHLYDPHLRVWQPAGELHTFRYVHSATLLSNGDVLVVGGLDAGRRLTSSAEIYRATSRRWEPAADAPTATAMHGATLLHRPDCDGGSPPPDYPCGQVLLTGGAGAVREDNLGVSTVVPLVELYDQVSNTWAGLGGPNAVRPEPMLLPRAQHSATLLPDGEVLVAGGFNPPVSVVTATAEVFDPTNRRWRSVASMTGGRGAHTATVLQGRGCDPGCGRVLVAGGEDAVETNVHRLATAELYTPAPWVSSLSPSAGPSTGGQVVVVEGTTLGGTTQVRFGGVPAAVTAASTNAVTVTTPEHESGEVEVEVISPSGTSSVRAEPERRTYAYRVSRPPGAVGVLSAETVSSSTIRVRFGAASGDGPLPPPANRYVVKVATSPITDDAAFAAAAPLCGGECALVPPAVGAPLSIEVGDLIPGTTYHFAARAINEIGAGPLSNPASATTEAVAGAVTQCAELPAPGPGQVAYPGGYSLVGLPQSSVVGAGATLYTWFDQGAGGRYSSLGATDGLAAGHGYWAWLACPRLVSLGQPGPTPSLHLSAYRASMVGNPTSGPVTVSSFDWAARWDPALNAGAGGYHLSAYREAQTLAPGQGIWVFSYTDTTVVFAAA